MRPVQAGVDVTDDDLAALLASRCADSDDFEAIPAVRVPHWQETALWWPERRVLVTADALGTVAHYFTLGGERLGVHPLLRLTPPRQL